MSLEPPDAKPLLRQWRVIAAVFAAFAMLLAGVYFFVLRQDYAILYRGLRPAESATLVAALEQQGVHYRLSDDGAQISAPSSQLDSIRSEMNASNAAAGGVEGFELFDTSDMGLTDFAQKIRYQRALQGELTRTIMMMDGVVEARVHIAMPERALFRSERHNAEAAVTLVMHSPREETPGRIEGVQRLVSASVADLPVDNVVVLNARGEVISRPTATVAPSATGLGDDVGSGPADWARAIVGQALPGTPFSVSVEASPARSADAAQGAASVQLIAVLTEYAVSEEERESVRTALQRAGLIHGEPPEALVFRVGSLPAPPRSAAPRTALASTPLAPPTPRFEPPPLPTHQTPLAYWVALAAMVVAMGLAALFLRYWLGRPRLSPEEHESFAARLRAGLRLQEQGGVGGV